MNWKSIRLELASTGEFPTGSVSRALLLRVPLDDYDRIDRTALHDHPGRATVRRHWAAEPDQQGLLVDEGPTWTMRCNSNTERQLQFDDMPIRLGQHISIIEADGTVMPFRVASVR